MQSLTREELNTQVKKPEENRISVIVSIYNIQDYLPRAIESICSQSYRNLEILLVDDGSTDRSGKICDEYAAKDERIRVIHKPNGGLSSARNTGIGEAKGRYLTFVDGDDWLEETMYEDMLRALQTWGAQLVICNYKEISRTGIKDSSTEGVTLWEGREALAAFIHEDEAYRMDNAAWNKLYTRELLGDLRFPEGKLFEDIVYTTRLFAASKKTVYLDQAYYNYVTDRDGSIMNSRQVERILTDQLPAYLEKGDFLKELGEQELYQTHQYFFCKRMLLHYRQVYEQKPEGYKFFLKRLREILLKEVDWERYKGRTEWKGEYLRLRLFSLSPTFYRGFNVLNEGLLIPYKQRRDLKGREGIMICLSGGLGNQMFQYALYLYFKSKGGWVKIDDSTEYAREKKRSPQLDFFGIHYEKASPEEICHWTDSYLDLLSRIRRKLTGRKTRLYRDSYTFDPHVLELKDAYLYGWWQSEKYFKTVEQQVRQAFRFSVRGLSAENMRHLEAIDSTESVGVHIRRGDYLEADQLYGGICTAQYYKRAMEQMREQVPDCRFFLFTNDVPWVREHMEKDGVTIVEGNDEAHGYLDMFLMSRCKHNIIANSSFSWWAAWLNENPKKRIIAPASWMNGREMPDIYTDNMQTCI